jgi:hypothetical protein
MDSCSDFSRLFMNITFIFLHISSSFVSFVLLKSASSILQHPVPPVCFCYGLCICSVEIVEGWPGGLYRLRDRGANPVKATETAKTSNAPD